jgi:hypothetical protein
MNTDLTFHNIYTKTDLCDPSQKILDDAEIEVADIVPLFNECKKSMNLDPKATPEEIIQRSKLYAVFAIINFELTAHESVNFPVILMAKIRSGSRVGVDLTIQKTRQFFRGGKSVETLYKDAVNATKKYFQIRSWAIERQELLKELEQIDRQRRNLESIMAV